MSDALQIAPAGFAIPCPAMSGAEPCTGSNTPGASAPGREVRARRHAHAALDRRREVGEDVAEEVRRDDDVEARRVAHHARGERVHEHPLDADAVELRRRLLHHLVPEHVAEARRVRLRRARQRSAAGSRELEGVADDALDARYA